MTLTELRYLVALAECGHFRKAADTCNVSQPTLSIAIKKLEEELGIDLFERARHKVSPTPIGEQVVNQARTVLQEASNLVQLAEQGKDPLGTVLSVGAIYTVGPYLFPRLVSSLRKQVPEMPLYIEENFTASLRGKLSRGALDAIFVALPFTEPDVVTRSLYDEPFVVLMPEDHPLAKEKAIDPAALAAHKVLMMGEGHCFRDQVLEACPGLQESIVEHNARDQATVEGSSLETLKHMVAGGMGITVLPDSAASLALYGDTPLTVRPFTDPAPARTIALAWRVSYPRHQAIDALTDALREA
ncbi:LysR family transcriptional regulator [Halioglobus japonicus]|uniref:Hydrogen peroxide-inducible genes activator n=1 Tax=Halioglobus japonicus TaxID=930805 RepID=A0AAP8MCK1_9GAMM|nr:hydrogen peroxide-inducible genes activator [Halioglobus japonicus]AQA17393.1 LysR family transcriptional regulator [Halioglobus japonicus]PLW85315.1 hydrogen peroxide-inducible genes activator [Halioglobus japonicus]GHD22385.1 LysR family transcriptional regulator [Halioglobus japonicus]